MNCELRKLSVNDGEDIYAMLQEMPEDENGFMNPVFGKSYEEFKEWLKVSAEEAEKTEIFEGWKVPQTIYWLYDGEKPVACAKLRHFLTEALRNGGGNIGYGVRASERGKGYGRAMLPLVLREAKKLGLEEALITIHEDNEPSLRVALSAGGIVDKTENGEIFVWCPAI